MSPLEEGHNHERPLPYENMRKKLELVRQWRKVPLTLGEKILYRFFFFFNLLNLKS